MKAWTERTSRVDDNRGLASSRQEVPISRSVRRVVAMLDLLLEKERSLTVAELVAALGMSRTTAYETVRTLLQHDYLRRDGADGRYALGRRLYELGMAYREQVDLLREGGPIVGELRDESGETVQLSVLDHGMMLVLLKGQGRQAISIISHVGSRIPVNWAASGRLLVSDLSDEELRERLPRMIRPSPSGSAPLEVELLISQVRDARARGYAMEINQANAHAGAIAAPVHDVAGRCIATLSIVAPEHRLKGKQDQGKLISLVVQAAQELSSRLGAPGVRPGPPGRRPQAGCET